MPVKSFALIFDYNRKQGNPAFKLLFLLKNHFYFYTIH